MQYIDKVSNPAVGRAKVDAFLNTHWDGSQYDRDCVYDKFKRRIRSILLNEQKHFCCYCMRDMRGHEYGTNSIVTLEHVIPHHNNTDVAYYKSKCPCLHHVQYYHIDNSNRTIHLTTPPYPHFCAYENLVASCNGSLFQSDRPELEQVQNLHKTCNNFRGNNKIVPFFYISGIENIIEYCADGKISYSSAVSDREAPDWDDTIIKLNLENPTLVMFRKAWKCVVDLGFNELDVKNAINDAEQRMDLLALSNLDTNSQLKLSKDLYWKLFAQYHWFYSYYFSKNSLKH